MTGTRLPCGLYEADRLDYADGVLTGIFGEYVATHVAHCPACGAWLTDFEEVGRLLKEGLDAPDEPWRRAQFTERLHTELQKQAHPRRFRIYLSALGGILLVLALTLLPLTTQGGQFLDGVVQFGKVPTKSTIPPNQQRNLLDTLDFTPHPNVKPQVTPVAPLDLPANLTLTKHSITKNGTVQLLYEDGTWTTLLVWENAPRPGSLRTEMTAKKQIVTVEGVQILIFDDPRPNAVAAFSWVHNGVFFNVLVLASPHGNEGGFKLDAALEIVRALNSAQ